MNLTAQVILIIFGIVSAFFMNKNIFFLIDVIKYSLRYLLPISIILCFINISKNSELSHLSEILALFNIIQIIIWYLIEKKWNRVTDKQFYFKVTDRGSLKGLIIALPILTFDIFIAMIISLIIEVA